MPLNKSFKDSMFGRREWLFLAMLACGFIGSYFFNYIVMQVDTVKETWQSMKLMPTYAPPVGVDFNFLYESSQRFMREGVNPYDSFSWYPPFTVLFFAPFTFFSYYTAYLLEVVLTTLMLIATIAMLLRLAVRQFIEQTGIRSPLVTMLALYVGALLSMQLLTGYPYAYAMERGNNDAYPIFFMTLVLWLMCEKPKTLWWQVLCITMATHIKVYPAVFFLAIFWVHRWRSLLPIVVLNLAAYFSLGIQNAFIWSHGVAIYNDTFINFMPPNHAMASFTTSVVWPLFKTGTACPEWLVKGSLLVPLSLWGMSCFVLIRRGFSKLNIMLFLMTAIPLMNLFPAISNDYKIILLYPVLALFIFYLSAEYLFLRQAQALLICLVALTISSLLSFNGLFARTAFLEYGYMNPFTASKTPALLILQIALLVWIVRSKPQKVQKAL